MATFPDGLTYSYLAANCPAPVVPSSVSNPATQTPLTSRSFTPGETVGVAAKLSENAQRSDLVARQGGGGYAVAQGLALSVSSGLTLAIATGQAIIDGAVCPSVSTVALSPGVARVCVWMLQTGAISLVNNSLTPPSAACVLLGNVNTSSGIIGGIDYSGVMRLRGGTLWRGTGDPGTPADTPPASLQFFNRTAGGLYFWDGLAYSQLSVALASSIESATETSDQLTDLEQRFQMLVAGLFLEFGINIPDRLVNDMVTGLTLGGV